LLEGLYERNDTREKPPPGKIKQKAPFKQGFTKHGWLRLLVTDSIVVVISEKLPWIQITISRSLISKF
jgi:hypothetical protein